MTIEYDLTLCGKRRADIIELLKAHILKCELPEERSAWAELLRLYVLCEIKGDSFMNDAVR